MSDPHSKKASEIFKVSEADVTPEQRRFGKIANYLEWYSMGPRPMRSAMPGQNQQQLAKKGKTDG